MENLIFLINTVCVCILCVMMVILLAATRLKNGMGYLALVLVTTTVPVYFSNTLRSAGEGRSMWYVACFINLFCLPCLWLFVRSQLDKSFRFRLRACFHFIPAFISLAASVIYYAGMPDEGFAAEMEYLKQDKENLPALVNDVLLFGQLFIYFPVIFRFLKRTRQRLEENYSDSEYLTTRWVSRSVSLFLWLFVIVFVAYVISPRTDAWLIPILNVVAISYLTYNAITHPVARYIQRLPDSGLPAEENGDTAVTFRLDTAEMRANCDRIMDYLISCKAYCRQDLSLAMLAKETGIPQKNLSRSINTYLKRNFFELVNEMRVEEAKRRLLTLETSGYSIDSIYEECGFRTRSTFFLAFKKVAGQSPAQWLNSVKKN